MYGPPLGDGTNPRLFDATRWKLSPYAFAAILFGLASLLSFFVFGFRVWLYALVPAVIFMWRAHRWTEDGNGGAAMGRIAKWVVIAAIVPPLGVMAVAMVSTIADRITSGPPPWELARGDCINLDPPQNPEDESPNWLRVKAVDYEEPHLGQVVLVTNMEVGMDARVAATRAPDSTEFWDLMAATMCEQRVGDEVRDMLDESIGIGNMRWYFENLTRRLNPDGYGFLVCLAMNIDDSPMVGSVFAD